MAGIPNNQAVIKERREKTLVLLTRGIGRCEIAKELKVDPATVSRDIQYLVSQSQKFLDNLAKETLPFMYQTSIEGIRSVIKECWSIYFSADKSINWFQKLSALKLIKESNEALFKLVGEGPSILYVRSLEEKLMQIEAAQQLQPPPHNQIISR